MYVILDKKTLKEVEVSKGEKKPDIDFERELAKVLAECFLRHREKVEEK